MRNSLLGLLLCVSPAASVTPANTVMYEGTWIVTNRDLEGTMTAVVTDQGAYRWHGHFYGVWRGSAFSYKVDFTGSPDKLRGTAEVDGANYEWKGIIDNQSGRFRGAFGGDRYVGHFDLKRKT